MSIPFHPLADLFPLIEGAEFDELCGSIKANGLREEIVLFEDAILDGRNRYRACEETGIEPRFEQFPEGSDPYPFVIDKNIHRRHLNESQRALIAAEIATRPRGDWREVNKSTSPPPTVNEASKMLNISRVSTINARLVMAKAKPEQIKAIKEGKARVTSVAREIRKRSPAPIGAVGKNPDRIKTQRMNAQIWGTLRDAIVNLTSLPKPAEVMRIARFSDRNGLLDARLVASLNYLTEFHNAWRNSNGAAEREESPTDHQSDARAGDRAS